MAGIIAAESVHHRFKNIEKIHWRQIVILCEIIMLFAVGFMPQGLNAAANALVSFVCAMQVQTFRKVRGHAYASTMCIGNMKTAPRLSAPISTAATRGFSQRRACISALSCSLPPARG